MSNCGFCGQTNKCACFFTDSGDVTVLGNGFGGNHASVLSDFYDILFPGPFKFKSKNVPDPYPMGYIRRSTTQVIPASTNTIIQFDSITASTWPGNMADFGAHPYALTVYADGIYLVGLNVDTLASTAADVETIYIRKNATGHDIGADQVSTSAAGIAPNFIGHSVMALISLVAGDYLEGAINSSTGTTIVTGVVAGSVPANAHLWARWMGSL